MVTHPATDPLEQAGKAPRGQSQKVLHVLCHTMENSRNVSNIMWVYRKLRGLWAFVSLGNDRNIHANLGCLR